MRKTPEQTFAHLFDLANDGAASQNERDKAERAMAAWLKRHGKTKRDIRSILNKAAKDDEAANPPPQTPDPRDQAPNPYDIKRFDPASLVEESLKQYVTMSEHVSVICSLWTVFTHVYEKSAIAPRIALVSEEPDSGKSTLRKVMKHLVYHPNRAVLSTGPAIERFLDQGPCTILLDELDHIDAEARKRLQRIWNIGHERGAEISLMIGGKEKFFNVYAPMLAAGIGNFLAPTQRSRTFQLEMKQYTEKTRPARDYNVEGEVDVGALNSVYTFIHNWAAEVKLNPKPQMPPEMIRRFADDVRGLLAIAESCGPEWRQRACDAFTVLFEKEKAERPKVVILRHGLVIFDALELEQIKSTQMNKELQRLDLADANWNRYRGPSGSDYAHPLTMGEQAKLLEQSGIEAKGMRPVGGGKQFRGYKRIWFEEALRKYEPTAATPRLRLITPKAD